MDDAKSGLGRFTAFIVITGVLAVSTTVAAQAERLSFRGLELGATHEEVVAWAQSQGQSRIDEGKERNFFRCDPSTNQLPAYVREAPPSIDFKHEYEDGVTVCGFQYYKGFSWTGPSWFPSGVPLAGSGSIPRFYFREFDGKKRLFRVVAVVGSGHLAQIMEAYSLKYGRPKIVEPRLIFPFLDAPKTPLASWEEGKHELMIIKGHFHGEQCSNFKDARGKTWRSHCDEGVVTLVDRDVQESILSMRQRRLDAKEKDAAEKKKRDLKDI